MLGNGVLERRTTVRLSGILHLFMYLDLTPKDLRVCMEEQNVCTVSPHSFETHPSIYKIYCNWRRRPLPCSRSLTEPYD